MCGGGKRWASSSRDHGLVPKKARNLTRATSLRRKDQGKGRTFMPSVPLSFNHSPPIPRGTIIILREAITHGWLIFLVRGRSHLLHFHASRLPTRRPGCPETNRGPRVAVAELYAARARGSCKGAIFGDSYRRELQHKTKLISVLRRPYQSIFE